MTSEERARALVYLSRFIGTEVPAAFLQKTSEHCAPAGIPYIHPLQEGIYKPKGSVHAFCIWSRSAMGATSAVYPDALKVETDGTWRMDYAPKDGSLDSAVNRSLFAAKAEGLPILVIATSRPKEAVGGARYRILGLAVIEAFNAEARTFVLRGASPAVVAGLRTVQPDDDELAQVELREQLILPMTLGEPRSVYSTTRVVRARAFGSIVLEEYRRQCCVCVALFVRRSRGCAHHSRLRERSRRSTERNESLPETPLGVRCGPVHRDCGTPRPSQPRSCARGAKEVRSRGVRR
jgi:hypothetical protein